MVAGIAEGAAAGWADAPFAARLSTARSAVRELVAAAEEISAVPDDDVIAAMGELNTLVGQIDGLRVEITRVVRERGLYRLRGARNLSGWLRADPRTADDAWKLSRLSAMAPALPRITSLLGTGAVSLNQAGTACWQVSQLPDVPRKPEEANAGAADEVADDGETGAGTTGDGEEQWAGLWRSGDVLAAADELFARFMPAMDGRQLRVLGAHLREAADAQARAVEDYDDYAGRALRISRSLLGAGEVSGRLHAEAAEQVIAAFEELGAPCGPDDTRTKAQRWADALCRLVGMAGFMQVPPASQARAHPEPQAGAGPGPQPGAHPEPQAGAGHGPQPGGAERWPGPEDLAGDGDDDEPCAHAPHGHETDAGHAGDGLTPSSGSLPPGLSRPRVIVMVPLATLLRQPLAPGAVLGSGTPITAEAARRLSCDAEVVRLVTASAEDPPWLSVGERRGRNGYLTATSGLTRLLADAIAQLPRPLGGPSAVLDIGRQSQSWTPRQRDALYAMYGGRCAAPRCTGPPEVIHHVQHWADGGRTSIANGLPFCRYDHWLAHEGGWRVRKDADGSVIFIPPPRGWRPGTVYRRGRPGR